ncbi:hypothetical protein PUN28_011057 [Cardiocondyla obscurior]|uniref:Uncharacterized protein n=1 Tax=Cardiocondyla obscurior TaxID=286306 RepID=A0AAW2FPQ0_9HYME
MGWVSTEITFSHANRACGGEGGEEGKKKGRSIHGKFNFSSNLLTIAPSAPIIHRSKIHRSLFFFFYSRNCVVNNARRRVRLCIMIKHYK